MAYGIPIEKGSMCWWWVVMVIVFKLKMITFRLLKSKFNSITILYERTHCTHVSKKYSDGRELQ